MRGNAPRILTRQSIVVSLFESALHRALHAVLVYLYCTSRISFKVFSVGDIHIDQL